MRWRKRQYRCREAACPRKAFTESVAEIPPRARLTGRLCRQLARQVASGRSVAAVAAQYQVSWPVAHRHYAAHADALLTEPEPPAVLGIDETRRGTPKWIQDTETGRWVRTERFETNFTDLSGTGRLLGQVAGRTGVAVTGWLDDRGQDWKNQVAFVAIDPCAVYRSAISRSLPRAVIVVDHFHLVRLANQAVTKVRQRVTRQVWAAAARPGTRPGRTGAGCCAAASDSPSSSSTGCGTRSSPRRPPGSCSPPGSPRKNSATCWPCWPAPGRPVGDQQPAVRVLRLVRPRRRPRGHHPGQDHRGLVAADPRLHRHRHHQRRHRGEQPARQRRRPDRVRVPQPRQPAPQSTVALQTDNDQLADARVTSPLKLEEPL